MKSADYFICNRCVMDSTAPSIQANTDGTCNFCNSFHDKEGKIVDSSGSTLNRWVTQIQREGKGKQYDCVIGVSGGVDSTYTAYKAKELGLRPIAVHLDNGWNSQLAVKNIENTLNKLDIDLYTHVIDWNEFKDLQLSFLKASIPGMEIPTDHAIYALLNKSAIKFGTRYIINGSNFRMEHIMDPAWSEMVGQMDWLLIKNIHKQFENSPLKTYPRMTRLDLYRTRLLNKHIVINLLDLIPFSKTEAMQTIQNELGWVYYGGKHYESIYTRFTQGYIQPIKFGFDKRRAHHSNLICMGEMSRNDALQNLQKSPYPNEAMLREDKEFVIKKLDLDEESFEKIMKTPIKSYKDYKGYHNHKIHKFIYETALDLHLKRKRTT
ncbi:N-acetyl sugar amidotransferase [Pelagicoccus sp. SDUM812005]|uniref:N-acetyl sugar amidotransferase n=1 Tax=Pelagicoccus sp. SDUM812005 TaxID=3041257 RepID=UPI00280FCCFB|nr:N-acetyl sugar amidotransferase [Pelagicoccus sp. SDUM812005]MDQ8180809.1 N-acetyl sugar amidotransferase [Pelagicoccus sp. SDUM812005]